MGNMEKMRETILSSLQAQWETGVSHRMFSRFTFLSRDSKVIAREKDSLGVKFELDIITFFSPVLQSHPKCHLRPLKCIPQESPT